MFGTVEEDGNPARGPTSLFPWVGDMVGRFWMGDKKRLASPCVEGDDEGR